MKPDEDEDVPEWKDSDAQGEQLANVLAQRAAYEARAAVAAERQAAAWERMAAALEQIAAKVPSPTVPLPQVAWNFPPLDAQAVAGDAP